MKTVFNAKSVVSIVVVSFFMVTAQAKNECGHHKMGKGMQCLDHPDGMMGDPDGGPGPMGKAFKDLNLTAEQKQSLKEIHLAQRDRMNQNREAMKALHEKFQQAMASDASNEVILALNEQIAAKQAEMSKARTDSMLAIRAILTPEQRKKFGESHKKHMGSRGSKCSMGSLE